MTDAEITQWQNEIFTRLVIDELKKQRAEGKKEFLLDKYEVDRITKERLVKLLAENGTKKGWDFGEYFAICSSYRV